MFPAGRSNVRTFWVVLVVLALPGVVHAQQSLFNVPSATGTPEGGVFVQEQLNLGKTGESNFTVDYGVLPGLEVGVNLFHLDLWGEPQGRATRAMVMGNAVWTLEPTEWVNFQAGMQLGVGARHQSKVEPVAFGWASTRVAILDELLSFTVGGYAGTPSFLGEAHPFGPMVGFEIDLIPGHFHLQGDLMMGFNEAAVGVLGGVVFLPAGLQVAFGVQVPGPLTQNAFGLVLEVTRVPDTSQPEHRTSW